jgi:8-oxo-dGTP pyrophosphatase MutT (NUDIX family)
MVKTMERVALAIIVHKMKYLLVQRGDHKLYGGMWSFPGGLVEVKDQSIEEAAKRELFEETGYEGDNLKFLSRLNIENKYEFHIFTVGSHIGQPNLSCDEIVGMGWFSWPEIYRMNDSLAPWLQHHLRDLWFIMRHG